MIQQSYFKYLSKTKSHAPKPLPTKDVLCGIIYNKYNSRNHVWHEGNNWPWYTKEHYILILKHVVEYLMILKESCKKQIQMTKHRIITLFNEKETDRQTDMSGRGLMKGISGYSWLVCQWVSLILFSFACACFLHFLKWSGIVSVRRKYTNYFQK